MASVSIENIEQVDDILKEVNDAFFDIPFENSQFQTEAFVIAAAITPGRAYRAIGLRMSNKIRALQEAKFTRLNNEIDIDEIDEKISNGSIDKYELRREGLKRERAVVEIRYTDKLINDAITELNVLYKHFKALPKFTRAQFEAGEKQHFTERLSRQHELSGDQQSMINLSEDMVSLIEFEEQTRDTDHIKDEKLLLLSKRSTNIRENRQEEQECTKPSLQVL